MRSLTILIACTLLVSAAAIPAVASDRVLYRGPDGLTVLDVRRATEIRLAGDYRDASWSPDGQTIYYTDDTGVWAAAADGVTDPQLVVADPRASSIDVAPDGRHLAYDRPGVPGFGSGIAIVPLDGSSGADVTAPPPDGTDSDARWSPDGQSIAFRRYDQQLGRMDLRVATLNFADPLARAPDRVLLDRATYTTMSAPTWEPDGQHLAIVAVLLSGSGAHDLFRVATDGSAVDLLVEDAGFTRGSPVISPDGRLLTYARQCSLDSPDCTGDEMDSGVGSGVWTHDLGTGQQSLLAATPGIERDLDWTADGGTLAFESFFQDSGCHCDVGELDVTGLQGGAPETLATSLIGPLDLAVSPGVAVRVSGPTRVETAVAVSREAFDSAGAVVLARADVYADALSGTSLAGALDGPVLLSPPDRLPAAVIAEINRLGARRVVLLGDGTALSPAVESQLNDMVAAGDLDVVDRIGGATRYDTAALVGRQLTADHAYLVQGASADPGRGWPDATAVSGLAASEAAPLLLTEQDRLPGETAAAITDAGFSTVTIVGGTAAVSAAIEQQVRDLGVIVDRLAGPNRYETSVAVADRSRSRGADAQQVWVATGRNWPDTLAAGPAAAHTGGLLLLADGPDTNASAATWDFLEIDRVRQARVVGSPEVMPPAAVVAVERRAAS